VDVEFVTSSFCADCNCVEVASPEADMVLVRDTKDRSKPPLAFTYAEWDAFIKGVKAGEFDLKEES
jgi:hypothetical protein